MDLNVQVYLDLVLDFTSIDIPGLSMSKHSDYINAPSDTKHSESARFILNYAHEQTVHQGKDDLFALVRAAPLFPRQGLGGRGGVTSAAYSAYSPAARCAARAGDGFRWGRTSPSPRLGPLLNTRSMLRRNSSSLGVETPLAPLQPNSGSRTHCTWAAVPATPDDNLDVGSHCLWHNLSCRES